MNATKYFKCQQYDTWNVPRKKLNLTRIHVLI